jgi:rhodanese-related sulfurtransferase
MSKETSSTIGEQRKFNYALKPMSKEDFVQMMTADLPEAPAYFPKDAEINRSGARGLSELSPPKELTPAEVESLSGHLLLDIRSAEVFGTGHLAGSVNIGLGGQFAMWAGSLVPMNTDIIVIAETSAQVDEAVVRLARVGIENVRGFLLADLDQWSRAGVKVEKIRQLSVGELNNKIKDGTLQLLDVRRPAEYRSGHVPGAYHSALSTIEKQIESLSFDKDKETAVICAGGYRSSAAASLMQKHGFTNLLNVTGGTNAWVSAGYSVESSPN